MKHKKSHLISSISLLVLILSSLSFTSAQTSYLDSLDGKFALQFQISDILTLSGFQGATFSGKYHLGKRSAVRLGLTISLDDSNFDDEYIQEDMTRNNENSDFNSFGFTINSQYLYYLVAAPEIGFYLGGGPFFGFGTSEEETTNEISDSTVYKFNKTGDNFSVGLDAIIGIEWSFDKSMSLSAEYGIMIYYRNSEENLKDLRSTHNRTNKSFRITSEAVKFGISIYF